MKILRFKNHNRYALTCAFILSFTLMALPKAASAAVNQFGETGLLSMSTAETVGGSNLCLGLWSLTSSLSEGDTNKIMPVSLTYGFTKNIELGGSFPNISLNNDEDKSGRGFMNLTLKNRIKGTNRSPFKLAVSASLLKSVSPDPGLSGHTDYEAKILMGLRKKHIKLHLSAGYRTVDDGLDPVRDLDDEIFAGAALDISYHRRFRVFLESEWRTSRIEGESDSIRVTPGVQVFITPNLTFSGGVDFYVSDSNSDPDWRVIMGLSTCGGIGEYIVPIPRPPKPVISREERMGKPPIPILPKMVREKRKRVEEAELKEVALLEEGLAIGEEELAPVSKYEVEVAPGEEVFPLPLPALVVAPGAPAIPGVTPEAPKLRRGRVVRKFRIPELMFNFDRWALRPESEAAISEITGELMKHEGPFLVKIEGHTDSLGSNLYNEKLSLQRATAVANEMIERYNILPERVFIEGYGEKRPIASNETAEGRGRNRRVDILLIVPE